MSRKNKSYPAELKYQAVADYLSGAGSLRAICKKYKIGHDHLAESGKMVLCHKLFTFESPYRRKIRRFKTVLVV